MEEIENVPYKLPDGWREVEFKNIGNITRGVNFRKSESISIEKEGFVPVITASNIVVDILVKEKLIYVPSKKSKVEQKVKKGDIIIVMSTGSKKALGRAYFSKNNEDVFIGAFLGIVRLYPSYYQKFFYYFMLTHNFRKHLLAYTGSQINNIGIGKFKSLKVPIPFKNGKPDLEKQKEIAKRIEEIFQKIERAEELRKRSLEKTKLIFDSALNKIFKNAKEDGWKWMRLGEIAKNKKFSVVDGPFGTQLQRKHYKNKGVPLIRILNIKYGLVFDSTKLVYISEEDFERLKRSAVYPGDILLAKTGATIGKVCLFPNKYEKGLITSSCAKITLNKQYLPLYVAYSISSQNTQREILKISTGATRSTLTLSLVRSLKVPIPFKNGKPDLEKQKEIAEYLDNLNNKVKQLEELQTMEMEKLNKLKNSILNKAFRGELV